MFSRGIACPKRSFSCGCVVSRVCRVLFKFSFLAATAEESIPIPTFARLPGSGNTHKYPGSISRKKYNSIKLSG
jgi:hypothetical protein